MCCNTQQYCIIICATAFFHGITLLYNRNLKCIESQILFVFCCLAHNQAEKGMVYDNFDLIKNCFLHWKNLLENLNFEQFEECQIRDSFLSKPGGEEKCWLVWLTFLTFATHQDEICLIAAQIFIFVSKIYDAM